MKKVCLTFFAAVFFLTAHGGTTDDSVDALMQNIRKVIPKGWTVSYDKQDSWLAISRNEAVWCRSEAPNSSPFEKPEKGKFTLAFRISAGISPAEYQRLNNENTKIGKAMTSLYEDLANRHVDHKFNEFFPKTDTDKAVVARYEALKKSLHDLPEYYFRDISLRTGLPPIYVTDGRSRDECTQVQEKVAKLLFNYNQPE